MKRFLISLLSFLTISSISYSSHAFEGPLQVKNQFPLFLDVDAPFMETASIENSFSANFSYSSVYLVRESSEWSIGLDMEIAERRKREKGTEKGKGDGKGTEKGTVLFRE